MNSTEETVIGTNETGFTGDVLDTPSLSLPPATSEIHHGTVVSVTTKVSENTGNEYGIITLQSKDNGLTFEFPFFPPQPWFDPANWGPSGFDADVLADTPPPGKKQTPREAFARAVSSKGAAVNEKTGEAITEVIGKEGTLQLLRKLATIEGFSLDPSTPKPTSGTEYVALINSLVAGRLEVLFTRKPSKNDDPAFDGQLKVAAIYPKTDEEKANFTKRFSTFRKVWEQ